MPAGIITALCAQANEPQRVNLFIDDRFAIGVSLNTIAKECLYVGKTITAQEFSRIEQAENTDKALQIALRLLAMRPRSTAEIRDRLSANAITAEIVETTLTRLEELGLLDDTAFARLWVEQRLASRPRGTNTLRKELHHKGVDREVVDTILNDGALMGDEATHARQVARKALHKYANATNYTHFARRLGSYLQRRGFNFDTIRPIIDQLWAECQNNADNQERDIHES